MKNEEQTAFPVQETRFGNYGGIIYKLHNGLTKREYIATMALQGLLANEKFVPNEESAQYSVSLAIKTADLLLKELEVKKK